MVSLYQCEIFLNHFYTRARVSFGDLRGDLVERQLLGDVGVG